MFKGTVHYTQILLGLVYKGGRKGRMCGLNPLQQQKLQMKQSFLPEFMSDPCVTE